METPGSSKKRIRSAVSAEGLDHCGTASRPKAKRPMLAARSNGEINKVGASTPRAKTADSTFATPRPPQAMETPPCTRKRCFSHQTPDSHSTGSNHQFKATPVDKRIFEPNCAMGIPRSAKRPTTQIKPFSDRFEKANQELLERRRKLQESGEHLAAKKWTCIMANLPWMIYTLPRASQVCDLVHKFSYARKLILKTVSWFLHNSSHLSAALLITSWLEMHDYCNYLMLLFWYRSIRNLSKGYWYVCEYRISFRRRSKRSHIMWFCRKCL